MTELRFSRRIFGTVLVFYYLYFLLHLFLLFGRPDHVNIKSRMPAARKTNRASHSGEMLSFVSKQSISGTQTAAPPPVSEAAVVRDLSSRGCRGLGLSPEQAAGTPACTRSCASPFGGCVSALCVCCVQGAVPGPWRLGGQDPAGACGWGVGIGKGQRVGSGR